MMIKQVFYTQHKPLLLWILTVGLVVSVLIALFYRIDIGVSVFLGVLFMLGNQYLMMRQIISMDTGDSEQGQRQMMFGAAKRFAALIIFLVIMFYLGLNLLGVAAGLAVAYLNLYAYSAAALFRN